MFTPPTAHSRPKNATAKFDSNAYISSGGPLHVSYPRWVYPISSWLASALSQFGFPQLPGFVDGHLLGWSYMATTIDPNLQTRSSSETSFLRAALQGTTNLHVYKSTLAKKIIFDKKRASAVEVNTAGVSYIISAKKEIIVSAGTVSFTVKEIPKLNLSIVSITSIIDGVWNWASRHPER